MDILLFITHVIPSLVTGFTIYFKYREAIKTKSMDFESQIKLTEEKHNFEKSKMNLTFHKKIESEEYQSFFQTVNSFNFHISKIVISLNEGNLPSIEERSSVLESIYNCMSFLSDDDYLIDCLDNLKSLLLKEFRNNDNISLKPQLLELILECQQSFKNYRYIYED